MNFKVLIVDDHTLVRKGFIALLLSHYPQWEIREAENGVQAILLCSTEKQDLVLMDYDMPKLNGIAAARHILKQSPQTRILLVTMHTLSDIARQLQGSGILGMISKDDRDEVFLEAIEKVRRGIRHFPDDGSDQNPKGGELHGLHATRGQEGLDSLTQREMEIFRMLASGRSSSSIADTLSISIKTLDTHKMSIFRKCGVHSIPDLVRFAYHHNAG